MEWAQILAIVLPIFFAIIIGIFYQNKRFEDVNKRIDNLRDEAKELKSDLREIKTLIIILI